MTIKTNSKSIFDSKRKDNASMGNSILNKAKYTNNTDEWYTDYKVIEDEVNRYAAHFKNKVVLCNCDNPYKSAFSKYFLTNFIKLNIQKLICTSYSDGKKQGYLMIVDKKDVDKKIINESTINDFIKSANYVKLLKGTGDFGSPECIKYLQQADIIVTNPPFSKFKEFFSLLVKYKKQYLIIGNQNALTYKEIFPLIMHNEAWIGYKFGDMSFKVPQDTEPRSTRFWIDENGQKWRSLGNAMWLTNLDNERKHEKLVLKCRYDSEKYPKYDNFNAINVSRVAEIPKDYEGIMGVPLTFLKYHNEEQFEIVGEANHGSDNEYDLFKPKIKGKELFKRILIKHKQVE